MVCVVPIQLLVSNNLLAGHEVVRLPVAHCELSLIEMAWCQVKGYMKNYNKKYIFGVKCFCSKTSQKVHAYRSSKTGT